MPEDFNRKIIEKTLYESIWKSRIEWQKDIIQYIIVVVGVVTLMKYGIEHQHLFVATILSQLSILWILAVILVASYNYRQFQLLSSRLEIIYEANKHPCVLPESFNSINKPKPFSLPEIYKIHFAFFSILLLIVSGFYIRYVFVNYPASVLNSCLVVLFAPVITISLFLILYFFGRKCLKKCICNCIKECGKSLFWLLIFFSMIVIIFVAVAYCDKYFLLKFVRQMLNNPKVALVVIVFHAGLIGLVLYWLNRHNSIEKIQEYYGDSNIKEKAYELFQKRGCKDGDDLKDWFEAVKILKK